MTTFAIFNIPIKTNNEGMIISEYDENDYISIAHRIDKSIYIFYQYKNIITFLKEDTKVYPIDNTPQGIYTINDILKQVNDETN